MMLRSSVWARYDRVIGPKGDGGTDKGPSIAGIGPPRVVQYLSSSSSSEGGSHHRRRRRGLAVIDKK